MDVLNRLLGHDRWATSALLALSLDLTDGQLDRSFDIGHGTLRDTFEHMIFNVEAWTALMEGRPVESRRDERSISDLIKRHERSYDDFEAAARRARGEGRLDATFIDDYDVPQSLGGTIVHVAWHNALHRGEARHILDRLGVAGLPEGDPQEWEHEVGFLADPA